ncbi:MAG TPA: hypothetical protein VGI70_00540, partial [Polyangiales bacterium]
MIARTSERRLGAWLVGLALLLVPAFEIGRHLQIVSRVPSDDDYRDAAAFVRSQIAPRDLIVSAPGYIDPIVRLHLGDLMPLAMVGRSDDAAYERVWVLSIDGAIPADVKGKPSFNRSFGRVRVLRYALGKSRVLYDFVQHWSDAEASLTRGGQRRSCRRRS